MRTKPITVPYAGEMRTLHDLAALSGAPVYMLYKRIRAGMSAEEAIYSALNGRNRRWEYRGQRLTTRELSDISGIHINTLNYRLRSGWSAEDAVSTPVGAKLNRVPPPKQAKRPKSDTPEGMRWNAAMEICRKIASTPSEWNFRCVAPMTEYAFESDLLGYRIRFLSPGLARLTAYWRNKDVDSDLYRVFEVNGEEIKEVQQG